MIKIAFVRAAECEMKEKGQPVSASKLSVMTGVHRKDVTRIVQDSESFDPSQHVIAKIMAQWQHHPDFRTKARAPRVLTTEGRESEFARLVESVNGGNVSAYAILFEMERMGIITRGHNSVKLVWQDFAPEPSLKDGLTMLAGDTDDLVQAVEQNIFERQEPPNLHLKTVMDNIVPTAMDEIRRWILEEGSQFHRRVREKLSTYDCDLNPKLKGSKGGVRIALGTFSVIGQERKS